MKQRRMSVRSRGHTLFEVALYTALTAALGAPLVATFLTATSSSLENDLHNRLAERNRIVVDRVSSDVRRAMRGSAIVENAGRVLTLTLPAGYDETGSVAGDQVSYEIRLNSGETVNGADDNGDGIVDDGRIVRRNLMTGEFAVVCAGVAVDRSAFAAVGSDAVQLSVTNVAAKKGTETQLSVSSTVTVNFRN